MPNPATISIELPGQAKRPSKRDQRKQTIYVSGGILAQIKAEGERIDRGMSWVVQEAWRLAYDQIRSMPTATGR